MYMPYGLFHKANDTPLRNENFAIRKVKYNVVDNSDKI